MKYKDCIATEAELFSRGRERDELLARLRRGGAIIVVIIMIL